jgi:hypothetical protein
MNLKRVVTFVILFLLTLTFTTTRSSSALTSRDGPSAFGEGQFTFTEPIAFSFNATVNKNGKGKGSATFDYLRSQTRVEVKLNCVVIEEFEVVMSGRVQHSDHPDFPKGVTAIFAAIDGSQVPVPFFPDQITPIFTFEGFDFDCTTGSPLTILLLDFGDIVIQP